MAIVVPSTIALSTSRQVVEHRCYTPQPPLVAVGGKRVHAALGEGLRCEPDDFITWLTQGIMIRVGADDFLIEEINLGSVVIEKRGQTWSGRLPAQWH